MQDVINVQGENFSAKSIIVQGENKRAGGIEKTQYVIEDLLLLYYYLHLSILG